MNRDVTSVRVAGEANNLSRLCHSMKYLLLASLICCVACTGTIDSAANRFDESGAKLVDNLKGAIADASPKVANDLHDGLNRSIDHLTGNLANVVKDVQARAESLPSRLIDKLTGKLTGSLSVEDQAGFEKTKAEKGFVKAIQEYWLEILSVLTGTGSVFKAWIERRRRQRESTLHLDTIRTITDAVEESPNKEDIKERVASKLKVGGDTNREIAIRTVIRRAKGSLHAKQPITGTIRMDS